MKILIVDDDKDHLELIQTYVDQMEYRVYTATDGESAWELWQTEKPRMVISDWQMPGLSGLDLCRKIREADTRYTYVIILSVRGEPDAVVHGLEGGADDYITKPVAFKELKARIEIGQRILNLENELIRENRIIRENYYQTIRMFSNLMELFDNELGGHARRTARISLKLAERHPDIDEEELQTIESAALLHDIGMIGLPMDIRNKKRTERVEDENELYRSHSVLGEIILKEIEFLEPISKLVRWHHEQYNGRGFPDGLEGEDIPLAARIIYVASVYDNLVHRGKTPLADIPEQIIRMRGYQLDPALVDILLRINEEQIEEEAKRHYKEVSIHELEKGVRLAQDVRRFNGALILPANTEVSGTDIEKLKKHCEIACISDKVFIYKDSDSE